MRWDGDAHGSPAPPSGPRKRHSRTSPRAGPIGLSSNSNGMGWLSSPYLVVRPSASQSRPHHEARLKPAAPPASGMSATAAAAQRRRRGGGDDGRKRETVGVYAPSLGHRQNNGCVVRRGSSARWRRAPPDSDRGSAAAVEESCQWSASTGRLRLRRRAAGARRLDRSIERSRQCGGEAHAPQRWHSHPQPPASREAVPADPPRAGSDRKSRRGRARRRFAPRDRDRRSGRAAAVPVPRRWHGTNARDRPHRAVLGSRMRPRARSSGPSTNGPRPVTRESANERGSGI